MAASFQGCAELLKVLSSQAAVCQPVEDRTTALQPHLTEAGVAHHPQTENQACRKGTGTHLIWHPDRRTNTLHTDKTSLTGREEPERVRGTEREGARPRWTDTEIRE